MPQIDLSGPIVQPPKNPLDDFDPNVRPNTPFATYCPGRRNNGSFKTHGTRASALNGLRYQGIGILYAWKDGKWVEVARFDPERFRPTKCEQCGQSTVEPRKVYDWKSKQYVDGPLHNAIIQTFVRRNGKLADPLTVVSICKHCKQGLGY